MIEKDGTMYSGMWKGHKFHGEGVLKEPGKEPKKGIWEKGELLRWIE